jgi:AbrB family looped-hinge helix DNA binding protein
MALTKLRSADPDCNATEWHSMSSAALQAKVAMQIRHRSRDGAWTKASSGITGRAQMPTIVMSNGQVTIPKPVRERLGIRPGDVVDFQPTEDGRFMLVKVGAERPRTRTAALRGRAGAGMSTDEIMALSRGEP